MGCASAAAPEPASQPAASDAATAISPPESSAAEPASPALASASASARVEPAPPLPDVGAACRGKDIDLSKALAAKECTISEEVAKQIGATRPSLRFGATATPMRPRYGAALTVTLTITNEGPSDVPLAFSIDPDEDLAMVHLSGGAAWFLPPASWARATGTTHYASVIVAPGGTARAKVDTQMKAMVNSFDMSCQANCPRYREAQWDPGASFPPGRYTLTGSMSLLGLDPSWSAAIDVVP